MIFIGYPIDVKGYLLWDPHSQKCVISKNMIFDEKSILRKSKSVDGAGKTAQDSSKQHSQLGDLLSTSGSKRVQFEMELGRHGHTPIEDQRGEDVV